MEPVYYYLFGGAAVLFIFLAWYLRVKGRKELAEQAANPPAAEAPLSRPVNQEMLKLQLQAYERLMILAERIGLEQLMGRFNGKDVPLHTYQHQLIQAVKTEFEYNVSQQLYVSATAWDAVKNLKEQHIFIINQLAAMLPQQATGCLLYTSDAADE